MSVDSSERVTFVAFVAVPVTSPVTLPVTLPVKFPTNVVDVVTLLQIHHHQDLQ